MKCGYFAAALLICAGTAFAGPASIGMVSAQNGVLIDDSKVSGSSTVFEGSRVASSGFTRLYLSSGTRLDLSSGTRAQVFTGKVSLSSGTAELQSPTGYELDTPGLRIVPSGADSVARVKFGDDRHILVTALNSAVKVMNPEGMLVARVLPGASLSFLPQAAAPNQFDNTGCVLQKSGAALLADTTGNQVFELRGMDLRKAIGNTVHVVGTVDSTATPSAGASQVVKATAATVTKKGGCTALATKLGATTAAAGLTAGVAGATAGGAAVAGATAGAAAAGAAGAAAAGAATAAGVSTAVVVTGVAVAAGAATVGGLAAAGTLSSTSP